MPFTPLNLDPCKQFHADLDVRPVDTTPACKLLTSCLWTVKSQQALLPFHSKAFQNDKLQKIRFENLARLTCLYIKDNEILESISASNLTDSYCIKISDNDNLKSIDFSDLINVVGPTYLFQLRFRLDPL